MFSRHQFIPLSLSLLSYAALACCAGIISDHYQVPFYQKIIGFLAAYAILYNVEKKRAFSIIILSSGIFIAAALRHEALRSNHINEYTKLLESPFTASGYITDKQTKQGGRFSSKITIALSSITQEGIAVPSKATIVLYTLSSPQLEVGDLLSIDTPLSKKGSSRSSLHFFDKKHQITASFYIPHLDCTLQNRPRYSLIRTQHYYRNRIANRAAHLLSKPCYTLFCTLFLGMRQSTTASYEELYQYCSYWGVLHYLSRSGLHALIVASGVRKLLIKVPLSFFLKELLIALSILFYYILTWPSVAFTRAVLTILLQTVFKLQKEGYKALHLLALVALIVLFINPLELFSLEFQLSFGLTAGLAWFNECRVLAKRIITPKKEQ